MRYAGVLVLASNLEGEPRAYSVQWVNERDLGDPATNYDTIWIR